MSRRIQSPRPTETWLPRVLIIVGLVAMVNNNQVLSCHAFSHPIDTRQKSSVPKMRTIPDSIFPLTTTSTIISKNKNNHNHHHNHKLAFTTLWRQPNKWDFLDDDDDDDDATFLGGKRQYTACPPDMMYEPRIVQRAHQTFLAIRQAGGGKELTNDVYVRDPVDKDVFWYTGKVARVSDVTLSDCIHRLYPMIERHACHLRPKELYPYRGGNGTLEVWTAPGDSELEVAYNRPSIQMQRFVHSKEWHYKNNNSNNNKEPSKYPLHIKASMVGFQGEVYQEGEDGFRTWRNDDGLPARPELNPGGETRPPTPDELAQWQQDLSNTNTPSTGTTKSMSSSDQGGYIDADFTNSQDKTS